MKDGRTFTPHDMGVEVSKEKVLIQGLLAQTGLALYRYNIVTHINFGCTVAPKCTLSKVAK